jgi:predicted outer membrane protein
MHLKQNTQLEASNKGMFDKKGAEEVENMHSKTKVILNRGALDRD